MSEQSHDPDQLFHPLRLLYDSKRDEHAVFKYLVQLNNFEAIKLVIQDPKVDVAFDYEYIFVTAAACGNLEMVNLLLADVNPSAGCIAITEAAAHGHAEVVKLLLTQWSNPAADDNIAIRLASRDGHTSVVEVLLGDPRVNPSAIKNSAIKLASMYGRTEIVKLLLADPRVRLSDDGYELMQASYNNHYETLKFLLGVTRTSLQNFRAAIKDATIKNREQLLSLWFNHYKTEGDRKLYDTFIKSRMSSGVKQVWQKHLLNVSGNCRSNYCNDPY